MDPLTVIVRIAAKHGISKLINALTGDIGFGDVAAELFTELAASERQLDERLAGIERQLDEVLEQPYRSAVGTGLRTLLDAGTTTDAQVRADELVRATALFREASAAARSTLQVAVAERYLVLCAVALGRRDAARTALGRLDHASLAALTAAHKRGNYASASFLVADQAERELGPIRRRRALGERTTQLVVPIQRAATEAGELSVQLLREAAVLARGLGLSAAPPPELHWLPPAELLDEPAAAITWGPGPQHPKEGIGRVEVRAAGAGPLRVGPLSVEWHHVGLRDGPRQRWSVAERTTWEYLARDGTAPRAATWDDRVGRGVVLNEGPEGWGGGAPTSAGAGGHRYGAGAGAGAVPVEQHPVPAPDPLVYLIEVDFTIRAEPPFPEFLGFSLKGSDPHGELTSDLGGLSAGEREARVRRLIPTTERQAACTLHVGNALVFPSP